MAFAMPASQRFPRHVDVEVDPLRSGWPAVFGVLVIDVESVSVFRWVRDCCLDFQLHCVEGGVFFFDEASIGFRMPAVVGRSTALGRAS